MSKPKIINIQEKIYEIPLTVFIGSYKKFTKYLRKKYNIEADEQKFYGGCHMFLTNEHGGAASVVWMPRFEKDNVRSLGTLSHEINHAVVYILDYVGIKISTDCSEPFAYLSEYFFERALKKIKENKND